MSKSALPKSTSSKAAWWRVGGKRKGLLIFVGLVGSAIAATTAYTQRQFSTDPISYWRYPISLIGALPDDEDTLIGDIRPGMGSQLIIRDERTTDETGDYLPIGQLRVWDARTLKMLGVMEGLLPGYLDYGNVAFNAATTRMAVTKPVNALQTWSLETGEVIATELLEPGVEPGATESVSAQSLQAEENEPVQSDFAYASDNPLTSPDGKISAAFDKDKQTITLSQLPSQSPLSVIRSSDYSPYEPWMTFSEDGSGLYVSYQNRGLTLFSVATGEVARRFPSGTQLYNPQVSGDGNTMTVSLQVPVVQLWESARQHVKPSKKAPQINEFELVRSVLLPPISPRTIAMSDDGSLFAVDGYENTAILIGDADTGEILHELPHTVLITGMAFSPDNAILATLDYDRVVQVWDVETGTVIRRFDPIVAGADAPLLSQGVQLIFIDDEPLLLIADGSSIRLVDMATGQLKQVFTTKRKYAEISRWERLSTKNATSSGGRTLAFDRRHRRVAGDVAGSIYIWNVETGQLLRILSAERLGGIRHLAFSDDGRTLAVHSGPNDVSAWDIPETLSIFEEE